MESERVHRITLSAISDAVFVADDEGRLTYVCPNVHVIFGHSRQEVWRMGRIERLLGEGLFEPEQLDARGELTNIERSVTDRREARHVLLINIKRVSIAGGTVLYSCRDITERKAVERQLAEERGALADANTALRGVLDRIEEEKQRFGEQILHNVQTILLPLLEIVERSLPVDDRKYAVLLRQNLDEIVSPFVSRLSREFASLTPAEVRICSAIRAGRSSKEIAAIEHICPATVKKHRENIRRKLGLCGSETNLATYLRTFMTERAAG
jgi:PAS domain S-box-containing protein